MKRRQKIEENGREGDFITREREKKENLNTKKKKRTDYQRKMLDRNDNKNK